MADRNFKNADEFRTYLGMIIAEDEKRISSSNATKYKLQNWRNAGLHLIKLTEHGYEISDMVFEDDSMEKTLLAGWRKNRWDETIGTKTAKQIAHVMGYDLTVEIAQAHVRMEKEQRNNARYQIKQHYQNIMDVEQSLNEYLKEQYPGNLKNLPRGVTCTVSLVFTDAEGNQYNFSDTNEED